MEQSVNWQDDGSVIEFTLAQKKGDGTLQFTGGVVILPREEIDRLNNQPTVKNLLSYERQRIDGNPFHGNILIRADTPKPILRMLAAALAVAVAKVIRP